MRYLKAKNILPEELIRLIQEYVDGEFLYIPRKDGEQKDWGEKSGSKALLKERNNEIYRMYLEGYKISDISVKYIYQNKA
jgi:hypothetical protein